jgi:hypothetical protein
MKTRTAKAFVPRLPRIARFAAVLLTAAVALPAGASAQTVEDCQRQLDKLATDVQGVTITGQNAAKNRTGLIAKVDDARVKLSEGKFTQAIEKLDDFKVKIGQLQASGAISVEDATRLAGRADDAIACIESLSTGTATPAV